MNFFAADKENPDSWIKFTNDSCTTCAGTCCTMPIEIRWEDLQRLNFVDEGDLLKPLKTIVEKLKKENVITAYRKDSGLFAFKQTPDGKCRYLVGNKCQVYKNRPAVCRAFPIKAGWRHGFCPQNSLK